MIVRRLSFGSLLLMSALLFMLSSGTCSAATYSITGEELIRLESNLTQLQQYNKRSLAELQMLKTQLKTSQEELSLAGEQSTRLVMELGELKLKSEQAENLLKTANESLAEFAKEEQRTKRRLKRQRNIGYGLVIGMAIAMSRK